MKNLVSIICLVLIVGCGKGIDTEEIARCLEASDCSEVTLQTEAETNDNQNERLDDLEDGVNVKINKLTLTSVLSIGGWNADEDRDTKLEFAFSKKIGTLGNGTWRKIEVLFIAKNLSEVNHVKLWEKKTSILVQDQRINVWTEVGGSGGLRTVEVSYTIGQDEWMEMLDNGNVLVDGDEFTVTRVQ